MKRYILFALILCLALVGCNKDEGGGERAKGFEITSVEYGVDAALKEVVLADLMENEPFSVENRFFIDPSLFQTSDFESGATGVWRVYDDEGNALTDETYTIEVNETEYPFSCPAYFLNLLPARNIFRHMVYRVGSSGIVYHMFVIQRGGAIGNPGGEYVYLAFYEDLTEYCKARYPQAGVNAVVRAYVSDGWSKLE